MTRGRGSGMLRFDSLEDLNRQRAARRERHQAGAVHLLEKDVLASVLELLKRHPKVAFADRSNTGSGFLIRRDVYERLVRSGAIKPEEARFARYGIRYAGDVVAMLRGGQHLEVECKSDKGRVDDDQQTRGDAINGGGGKWIVARSIDDVLKALE